LFQAFGKQSEERLLSDPRVIDDAIDPPRRDSPAPETTRRYTVVGAGFPPMLAAWLGGCSLDSGVFARMLGARHPPRPA